MNLLHSLPLRVLKDIIIRYGYLEMDKYLKERSCGLWGTGRGVEASIDQL